MIATVKVTFVDAPKGRKERKYLAGDVIDISKDDFDRISAQNAELLSEGKTDMGTGICYPCTKKQELAEVKETKSSAPKTKSDNK